MAISFRTRFQRGAAACTILRDLSLRTTNPVIREYCNIAVALLSAPSHERAAIDARAAEMVHQAETRREKYCA